MPGFDNDDSDTSTTAPTVMPGQSKPWAPESKLETLVEEIATLDDGDQRRAAERIMQNSLGAVASRIVHIALYDQNSNTALKAAQYVTDRTLGPVGATPPNADAFADFISSITGVNEDGTVAFEVTE